MHANTQLNASNNWIIVKTLYLQCCECAIDSHYAVDSDELKAIAQQLASPDVDGVWPELRHASELNWSATYVAG